MSNGIISPTSEPQASFTHRSISAISFFSRSRLSALFAVGSEQPEADGIPDGAAADKAYVSFARSFFRGYCKQKYFSSRYRSRGISYFFGKSLSLGIIYTFASFRFYFSPAAIIAVFYKSTVFFTIAISFAIDKVFTVFAIQKFFSGDVFFQCFNRALHRVALRTLVKALSSAHLCLKKFKCFFCSRLVHFVFLLFVVKLDTFTRL
ncbi:MAG: hypothetical protein UCK97_01045 [Acutalibacteraceae bacterium]|nr:hypothetical protein [Acutalibacteraceae bacterium]